MSFIFEDKNLLKELFKLAQEPPATETPIDYEHLKNKLSKLVADLKESYFPAAEQEKNQQEQAPAKISLPFDLTTDIISLDKFTDFLSFITELLENDSFKNEMKSYTAALAQQVNAISNGLLNFENVGAYTAGQKGGFSLSAGLGMTEFIQSFADNDFIKARNMLNVLSSICAQLSGVLNMLRSSEIVKEQIGESMLRNQVQRGRDYVNRINGLITQIDNVSGRR